MARQKKYYVINPEKDIVEEYVINEIIYNKFEDVWEYVLIKR